MNTLETDIAITRDGVLVISHDPALNPDITRGPDGQFLTARGPVIWLTDFAELQRYDVGRLKPGTRYAALYPEQKPHDGARLPRLDELFALVKKSGNAKVRLALETKLTPTAPDETMAPEPFARALIEAVRDAGFANARPSCPSTGARCRWCRRRRPRSARCTCRSSGSSTTSVPASPAPRPGPPASAMPSMARCRR